MYKRQGNKAAYQTTETVDLEYVELALEDIANAIDVSEEALRKAYDEEQERFRTAEERHARHILVAVEDGNEEEALKAWGALEEKAKPGVEQQTMRLHAANILVKLDRRDHARALLVTVTEPALQKQKQTVLDELAATGEK